MSKSGQSHFSKLETKITLALFLINFITGLLFINEGLFHFDSVVLAQAVEKTYSTGIPQPAVKGRYGSVIINAILHLPFHMMGKNADFTVRFSSVLFHSLSIVRGVHNSYCVILRSDSDEESQKAGFFSPAGFRMTTELCTLLIYRSIVFVYKRII